MAGTRDFSKGLVAGVAAGLAASFVMNEFQAVWVAVDADLRQKQAEGAPATEKAADRASMALSGSPVPEPALKKASLAVHYLTGATMGGIYGVLAEFLPGISAGFGSAYGGVLWAAIDETASPALGLSASPFDTGPKDHIYGLASHIAFGWALEAVRLALTEVL
jgi:putative membrane protein